MGTAVKDSMKEIAGAINIGLNTGKWGDLHAQTINLTASNADAAVKLISERCGYDRAREELAFIVMKSPNKDVGRIAGDAWKSLQKPKEIARDMQDRHPGYAPPGTTYRSAQQNAAEKKRS